MGPAGREHSSVLQFLNYRGRHMEAIRETNRVEDGHLRPERRVNPNASLTWPPLGAALQIFQDIYHARPFEPYPRPVLGAIDPYLEPF